MSSDTTTREDDLSALLLEGRPDRLPVPMPSHIVTPCKVHSIMAGSLRRYGRTCNLACYSQGTLLVMAATFERTLVMTVMGSKVAISEI